MRVWCCTYALVWVLFNTLACSTTKETVHLAPTELPAEDSFPELVSSQPDSVQSQPDAARSISPSVVCLEYQTPVAVGTLEGDLLAEVSGIVHSRRNPEILWVHNDSGDSARIFAIDLSGVHRATLQLDGVTAVDFEDIATGKCPHSDLSCLWIADIGDNDRERAFVWVHVVEDPLIQGRVPEAQTTQDTPVRSFKVIYPDGPINSEAMVVSKDGSSLWIFEKTKSQRQARIYRSSADLRTHSENEDLLVEEVGNFDAPGLNIPHGFKITAADLHPSEKALVLRVYPGSWQYLLGSHDDLANLGQIQPTVVALGPLTEAQGEAVAYHVDGHSIWTLSEDPDSLGNQPLNQTNCASR